MNKILHTLFSAPRQAAFATGVLLTVSLLTTSCVGDYLGPGGGGTGGKKGQTVEVRFTVAIPDAAPIPTSAGGEPDRGPAGIDVGQVGTALNAPSTRVPAADAEIRNVTLLVFEQTADGSGKFAEMVEATDIAEPQPGTGSTRYTFSARLTITPNPRTIHFIANMQGLDRADFAGKTEAQIMDRQATAPLRIKQHTPGMSSEEDFYPLTMWGRIKLAQISAHQTPDAVNLLRSAASVEVKIATASGDNGLKTFTLNRITAAYVQPYGTVPASGWKSWNNNPATPPDDTGYWVPESVHQVDPVTGAGYWTTPAELHYLWPRKSGFGTSLILDATWNGTRYYYRLELKLPAAKGVTELNICRNHKYIAKIVSVSKPGYTSLKEAIENPPSNDAIVAYVDELDELVSYVFSGNLCLGVSCNSIKILASKRTATIPLLKMWTPSPDYGHTWSDEILESGGTLTADPATGIITLSGRVSGTNATNGTLKLYTRGGAGNSSTLSQNVSVAVQDMPAGAEANSVYNCLSLAGSGLLPGGVMGSNNKWWSMEILQGSQNVFLIREKNGAATDNLSTDFVADGNSNRGTEGVVRVTSDDCAAGSFDNIRLCWAVRSGASYRATIRLCYMNNANKLVVEHWVLDGTSHWL